MKLVFDGRTKESRAARLKESQEKKFAANNRQIGGDVVNSPAHYTSGGIETIDFMRAKLTREQLKGYYVGNLLKYISRADMKNGVEDYKKAQVYLTWLIELEGRGT